MLFVRPVKMLLIHRLHQFVELIWQVIDFTFICLGTFGCIWEISQRKES